MMEIRTEMIDGIRVVAKATESEVREWLNEPTENPQCMADTVLGIYSGYRCEQEAVPLSIMKWALAVDGIETDQEWCKDTSYWINKMDEEGMFGGIEDGIYKSAVEEYKEIALKARAKDMIINNLLELAHSAWDANNTEEHDMLVAMAERCQEGIATPSEWMDAMEICTM